MEQWKTKDNGRTDLCHPDHDRGWRSDEFQAEKFAADLYGKTDHRTGEDTGCTFFGTI